MFEIFDNHDGTISFKSLSNANFVSITENNTQNYLIADQDKVYGPREKFLIINFFDF